MQKPIASSALPGRWSVAVAGWFVATSTLASASIPEGPPLASLDLAVTEDVLFFGAEWRYSDIRIVSNAFYEADANSQPSRVQNTVYVYEIEPHAGAAYFDDSQWQILAPESISKRVTAGKVGSNWYPTKLAIPEHIGAFDPTGSTLVLDISVDDCAEIWVNGDLPRRFPQSGGSIIAGRNTANHLVISRNVKPGHIRLSGGPTSIRAQPR